MVEQRVFVGGYLAGSVARYLVRVRSLLDSALPGLTVFCRASKDWLHECWLVQAAARVFRIVWCFAMCFGVAVCSGVANWRGGSAGA